MIKIFVWRSTIVLFAVLLSQLICFTSSYAFCVARDTGAVQLPDGSWEENCCSGRPAHWPASAMPIPVYIYDQTPSNLESAITDAIQTWNDIDSSFFELQFVGYTASKDPIVGAVVMGFDTSMCDGEGPGCMKGASSNPPESVNGSPDGFQIKYSIIFADSNNWDTGAHPDPTWVMTHEIGHALGILHPGNTGLTSSRRTVAARGCGPEFTESTMECCSRQTGDDGTLELDEIAAATYLYPKWKYTVVVVDSVNNPIQGAAVWMHGTCFPHDGADRDEGGMVFGDIPSCLVGDLEPSDTYYPNFTYMTGSDGRTGEFRVMHDEFCFTVVATGYVDSYGCQTLPAPGNYITTVTLNMPPVCNANGPYVAECQGMTTMLPLDGTGSYDPDSVDTLSYSWHTDCPGGSFDNLNSPTPMLSVNSSAGSLICNGSLTVTDSAGTSDSCSSTVVIKDTQRPQLACPSNKTVECHASINPSNTGNAIATDSCDSNPVITYSDIITPGLCPQSSVIARTWIASDASNNISSCTQTINVVDTTPPIISTKPPDITVECDAVPAPAMITATDNCDPNPTVSFNETRQDGNCPYNYKLTRAWSAQDHCGNTSTHTQVVTVQDTTPPTITSISASPNKLWPPNHKMVPVKVNISASDNCGDPVCSITSVGSNEPENGLGDGDTAPDWEIKGDLTVNLRAERSGTGNGRIYMITTTCTDECGNSSVGTVNVTVSHDQKK